jgi:hypothetical protein
MISLAQCRTYSAEYRQQATAADISIQHATILMAMANSWTSLANQTERYHEIRDSERYPHVD